MLVLRTLQDVRAWRATQPGVSLVPTMGAFHEGHLHLMREAAISGHPVAVSLFVNPLQFAPHEDLDRYPRQEAQDLALAEAQGVNMVFAPSANELLHNGVTSVLVRGPSEGWEGAARPGHFEGVATIVLKLFHLIQPQEAVFGWKDLQQCAVLRRMVEDLDVPVSLRFIETVREADGLAKSSRNVYLSEPERYQAVELNQELRQLAQLCRSAPQEVWAEAIRNAERASSESLRQRGWIPDYLAVVNPLTMQLAETPQPGLRVAGAAKLGNVRLLDNVPCDERNLSDGPSQHSS